MTASTNSDLRVFAIRDADSCEVGVVSDRFFPPCVYFNPLGIRVLCW